MSCKIYLDNYDGCYKGGEIIRGRLLIHLNKSKAIRAIKIRLKCKEHTEWTERESHYNNHTKRHESRYVTYRGDHDIINKEVVLRGEGNIGPGSFTFPFEFSLPTNIPSTFNGSYGTIHYYIKGIVDRSFKFDYEDKVFLTVFQPINFNLMDNSLQQPRHASDSKTICCFCCQGGDITCNMSLEKNAFVVGEKMKVKFDIENLSNVSIENIKLKLTQKLTSKVTLPRSGDKVDIEYVGSVSYPGVGAHGEHEFTGVIEIPQQTNVQNFSSSTLFEMKHKLEAVFEIDGCHTDIEISLYPILGHIAHEQQSNMDNQWEDVQVEVSIGGDYPPQPPPYAVSPNAIGFVVSDQANGSTFPNLPQGGSIPMPVPGGSAPYPPPPFSNPEKPMYAPGGFPSAPPPNADPNNASAPELPPPSYNEATVSKPKI